MSGAPLTKEETVHLRRASADLPPTPPESLDGSKLDYPLPAPSQEPTDVVEIDKKTPDNWVRRDPRLLRLTGVHPFNVEAPLTDLYNSGFLTDISLFYVRNHGAVPQVQEQDIPDWELSIEGAVQCPFTVTLRELIEDYVNVTYPITLVCAGNRRKEQNVVRKTNGFSWGAAGLSTALFTGVALSDLLQKAKPMRGARYVCMEGADDLPKGRYATSVKLNWALDPNRGFLLAHKMNGEPLRPDHGKPLRAVIPGQIGGRSVKWLKRLIISHEPSDSYYHLMDNRVLPTMISPEEAAADMTHWKDERTAIHDLSPNSAIAVPAHGEKISATSDADATYRVKGYAYSGGGRRVTRCELSLDKGKTWRLSKIEYAEDRYREAGETPLFGGTLDMEWRESCFCWCFWSLDIAVSELAGAKDILVRAMDESMIVQPRDMYWSVLGMMNNPWFRITITKEDDGLLLFKHPTVPINTVKGWMEEVKAAGGDLTNGRWGERAEGEEAAPVVAEGTKEVKMTKDGLKTITIDELRKHDHEAAPWFVVKGEVYDGTGFLSGHPGGAQSIISAAGLDSSDEFMAIHSENAKRMMVDYHVGTLDEEGKAALAGGEETASDEKSPIFLNPRVWKKAELVEKNVVSWDTKIFRFALDYPEQKLGLPTGQHLMMKINDADSGDAVIRSYTPISETSQIGFLDVLVKIYYDTKERKGGKMSQGLDKLPLNSSIQFKGPIGKFEYLEHGRCTVNGAERKITTFITICGGSGITPIFQVVRAVVREKGTTKCIVLDGNRLLEDILCKAELDAFAKGNEENFKLLYTLTQAPDDWQGLRGRIAAPLLKQYADPAAFDRSQTMILICGPEALEKSAHKALLELGWEDKDMLFF